MYYSMQQTSAPADMNRRLHKPKFSLRLSVIRFAFLFTVILAAFSVGAIVQANAGPADKGTEPAASKPAVAAKSQTTIIVEQGDTLWDIAQAHAPKGTNVRNYQEQVKRLNHLNGVTLRVGQRLLLP